MATSTDPLPAERTGSPDVFDAGPEPRTERFHFICDIASGGIGRVELAAKVGGRFRRLFAIKRLQEAYRNDGDFLEMFMEEARVAGLVRHPNVVPVLDVGVDARGPFLAMDYVEGVSAEVLVREQRKRGREMPLQLALSIAIDAAEGLHAAHVTKDAQGHPLRLVHRDVSPQNILVGYDGVSRVTDFGIAKALGRASNTDAGVLKGKLGYMSPEQLRFEEVDQRSDIFALGVVLYELLTCTRLYRSQAGMEGPQRILHEPPPDIGDVRPGLPPELVELVFAMLAKTVEERPATCLEVARRLQEVRAEVVDREGRLELAEYVQELLREQRASREAHITDAVERTGFGRTPTPRAEGSAGAEVPIVVTGEPPTRPVSSARALLLVVAGLAVLAVSAAGLVTVFLTPAMTTAPSTAAGPTAPAAPTATPTESTTPAQAPTSPTPVSTATAAAHTAPIGAPTEDPSASERSRAGRIASPTSVSGDAEAVSETDRSDAARTPIERAREPRVHPSSARQPGTPSPRIWTWSDE
jgi:serine/threonine-protein kinase